MNQTNPINKFPKEIALLSRSKEYTIARGIKNKKRKEWKQRSGTGNIPSKTAKGSRRRKRRRRKKRENIYRWHEI